MTKSKTPYMPREFQLIPRKPREWPKCNSAADYFDQRDQAEWTQLGLQQYTATSRDYFNRSYNLYPRSFEDYGLLFYCAFELRCAIERVFYEHLLHLADEKLSKKAAKLWAAGDLQSALLEIDPDFFWKVEFFNLSAVARKQREDIFPLRNLKRLLRDYGLLHPYLHAQKANADSLRSPLWWNTFRDLIESLHVYAWRYCAGYRLKISLDDRSTKLLGDLKSGVINRQQLIHTMREDHSWKLDVTFRQFLD